MAVTQTDIDSLNTAIASGTRSVTLDGQTITYNTTDSLIRARNDMVKQLIGQANALKPARRNKQTQLYQAGRGYQ